MIIQQPTQKSRFLNLPFFLCPNYSLFHYESHARFFFLKNCLLTVHYCCILIYVILILILQWGIERIKGTVRQVAGCFSVFLSREIDSSL